VGRGSRVEPRKEKDKENLVLGYGKGQQPSKACEGCGRELAGAKWGAERVGIEGVCKDL